MDKIRMMSLTLVGTLASCGAPADDPKTIPVSGKWIEEAKLTSLTVNGRVIDPSRVPELTDILASTNQKKEICGEPKDLNEVEFQEKMGSDRVANCTIDSRKVNGNQTLETASCDALNMPGVTERLQFTSETEQFPNKVVANASIIITAENQNSGNLGIITVKMQGSSTRLGDC